MRLFRKKDLAKEDPSLAVRVQLAERWDQLRFAFYSTLLVVLLFVGFLWKHILITIPAGHHGVLFNRLSGGTITDHVYGEGLYLIGPWNKLVAYETRLLQTTLNQKVLTAEGLELRIVLSLRYRPYIRNLGYLHRDLGPNYFERLIQPEVAAHLRRTFGHRQAHEIYTVSRDVLQEVSRVDLLTYQPENGEAAKDPRSRAYVILEELKIVDVDLPPTLVEAINQKQKQEQLVLEYNYRLDREEKEAARKRTEAAGIRDFSQIAAKVSPDLLRWRSVDAALELARSSNSKVIVLGGGNNPLMLNLGDAQPNSPQPQAKPQAAPPQPPPPPQPPEKKQGTERKRAP